MRLIPSTDIIEIVKKTLIKINYELDQSFVTRLRRAKEQENKALSKAIIQDILDNQEIAKKGEFPLCQDTGIVVVFAEIGFDVKLDNPIEDSVNQAVRLAYSEGYLRKSVVKHPFKRENTHDNTPAIVHTKLVPGDKIKIKIASKGAGSENMSVVKMLTPTVGIEGVKKFVLDTIFNAGGKPCPPIIVGIGLGGNLEKSALIAKEAILRDLDDINPDPILKELEEALYTEINDLGVGPMGVGGNTTCLGVKINSYPMHIASLPVAVNIQCHANRHEEVTL